MGGKTVAGLTHLSKSRLLSWLQCPKRLWLEVRYPEVAQPNDVAQRQFTVGHNVGEVARLQLPNGVLIQSQDNLSEALKQTWDCIASGERVLFEGVFQHGGVLVRTDILKRRKGVYEAREVKASGSIHDHHYADAAIQSWVMRGAGLKLDSVLIQHINTGFVYPGGGDYAGLFKAETVDDDIQPLTREVPKWVKQAQATLAGPMPNIKTGKQCHAPYDCPCFEYCAGKEPQTEYPLKVLPRAGTLIQELIEEGYNDVRDIPPGRLTGNRERVRRITKSGKAELSPQAKKDMRELSYPRYYLDFETVQFAVPIWAGTHPYQNIPFQWSCHVERSPGVIESQSYLDTTGASPFEPLAASLVETLGTKGPILAHNAAFEKSRIEELATLVPKRSAALRRTLSRFVDTLALARNYYYHPAMKGSWSLKAILPTIAPELDYENVGEVRDGSAASAAYLEIISSDSAERKAELREALERYCERDTLALVRFAHYLQRGR